MIKSVDLKDLTVTAGGKNVELTTDFTARDVNYYAYVDSNVDEVVMQLRNMTEQMSMYTVATQWQSLNR